MTRLVLLLTALELAISGCATPAPVTVRAVGKCTQVQRPPHPPLSVESRYVKSINAVHEFGWGTHIFSITLEPGTQEKEVGTVRYLINMNPDPFQSEKCRRIYQEQLSCFIEIPSVSAAGFLFRIIGTKSADADVVISKAISFADVALSCRP